MSTNHIWFVLVLSFFLSSQSAVAKNEVSILAQQRLLSLYLTHGFSYFDSQELKRVGVSLSGLSIGAGVSYDIGSEFNLNSEILFTDTYSNVESEDASFSSSASARLHQERVTVGGAWNRQVAKHLQLFPEIGLSLSRVKITLHEKSYHAVSEQHGVGGYVGVGAVVPIRRVFFDFRYKYQGMRLDMERIGADKMIYQSTILVGFGFVI
jgi:hypothetical protein